MRQFKWRSAALLALTILLIEAYSVAPATANNSDNKSGSSQSSASNNSTQGQNQASNSTNKNSGSTDGASQSNSSQGSRDSKNSDQNNSENQSNQGQSSRSKASNSTSDADSNRRSSSASQDRNTSTERDGRDSANTDRDDRSSTRDRSDRTYDRNDDRDRDSSKDRSSRRGNMRGPDIGIWFNRSSRDGLVISDISSRGAIAKLGFHEGDRIVSVNGHRVTREDEFLQYLLHGDVRRVKVIVLRDNREETIYVEPTVLTDEYEYTEVSPLERFGVVLDDRYDDRIVVWHVIPRSPAYYSGFRPGDVIVTFGGRPYRTRSEFETGARDWKTGDANVQIRRGDRQRDLSVEIPAIDQSDRRHGERSEVRNEQTEQHDSTNSAQRTSDRSTSDQGNNSSNNNRGGILNGIGRGRGNR